MSIPLKLRCGFRNEQVMYGGVVRVIHSGIYRHKYIPRIESDGQDITAEEKKENSAEVGGITDSSQVIMAGAKEKKRFFD